MRLLIAGAAFLVLGSATRAADPDEVEEIKKVIADLRVQVAKSQKGVETATTSAAAIADEYARKREAIAVVTKAATAAAEKAIAAPTAKADAARKAADKAEADATAADKSLGAAKDKLKTATDATEVAEVKKAIADLTVIADAKRTVATTARAAAKEAAVELAAATVAAKATADAVVEAGKQIVKLARADVKQADNVLVDAVDERDRAEDKLRKAMQRLAYLERK